MPVTALIGGPGFSVGSGSASDSSNHGRSKNTDRRRSSTVIPEIYEAIINPDRWVRVVSMIAKLTGSKSACLYYRDRERKSAGSIAHYGLPNSASMSFDQQFDTLDDLFCSKKAGGLEEPVCAQFCPGGNGVMAVDSSLYLDWMKPNGIYHVGGAQLADIAGHKGSIAILRDEKSGAWSDGDLRLVNNILPHLRRALKIHAELARLRPRRGGLYTDLDRLIVGLILYDRNARPVYINSTARTIINSHPALCLREGELILNSADENRKLHKMLLQSGRVGPDESWKRGVAIGITHPDIEAPLPLLVMPMHANLITSDLGYEDAKVAVFFSDSNQQQPISVDNLVSVYGLTPSEAQVAIGLANGRNVDEIAESSNHSVHTIRSQLKSVLRKTYVSRQTELIKLLLTGPLAIHQVVKLQLKNAPRPKPRATRLHMVASKAPGQDRDNCNKASSAE